MTDYRLNYSVSSDFGGSINLSQFHQEIDDESGITTAFIGLTKDGDDIEIIFEEEPSSGEQTIITSLISSHVPDFSKPRINFFPVFPESRKTKNSNYTTIATFEYPGSNKIGIINYIDVFSKCKKNGETYDIRVINYENSDVLVESTGLNNTDYQTIDLGAITNIPSTKSILEIQMRSSKHDCYLQQALIYHNN